MRSNMIATLVSMIGLIAVSPMGATALATEPQGSASARGVHVLGGLTSQGFPVLVEVSRSGRQVKRIVAGLRMHCGQDGRITEPERWLRLPVSRRGAFRASYRDSFSDQGAQVTVSDSLVGKVNARRTAVSATWRLTMVVREPNGTVDSCDSGNVRVTARR